MKLKYVVEECESCLDGGGELYRVVVSDDEYGYMVCEGCEKPEAERIAYLLNTYGMESL